MTEFIERNVLGGWSIHVVFNRATIGHIRNVGGVGGFGYYHGPNNVLTSTLQDDNLETLKEKVEILVRNL
jgi:hypothetical protein